MQGQLVCAVDVGTGSARAGMFDRSGKLRGRGEHPIVMNRAAPGHAEHDSQDIWRAVCRAVEAARRAAGAAPPDVAAISFDATCSLVARAPDGGQVSVSRSGEDRWDTIVWLDHRAGAEAAECTATGHRVLDHVGGVMSPEMQAPKLMWIKRHLPRSWRRAGHFFDLADFLTWRSTGRTDRSQCTLTCKWTYLAHEEPGWRRDFLDAVGLGDLLERGGLPQRASPVGDDLGPLLPAAAAELGLDASCRVGVGLIDAFAGALGAVGGLTGDAIESHLALIAGTSSCVMGFAREPRHASGVWGPYFGVALPDLWLAEAGQSATGALLDHVIDLFGGGARPDMATHARVAARIGELLRAEGPDMAADIHVVPDFHGNRSPLADPDARGVFAGLTLDNSFDGLCRVYWRTAVAIALELRQILDHLEAHRYRVERLHVAGGHARSALLVKLYADATGRRVAEAGTEDAVLLGTAMVAARAAGWYVSLSEAGRAMRREGALHEPDPAFAARFETDYRILARMQEHRREIDAMRAG